MSRACPWAGPASWSWITFRMLLVIFRWAVSWPAEVPGIGWVPLADGRVWCRGEALTEADDIGSGSGKDVLHVDLGDCSGRDSAAGRGWPQDLHG
jgi:hypothetical protein